MSTLKISAHLLPRMLQEGTEIHYQDGDVVTVSHSAMPGPELLRSVSYDLAREIIVFEFDDGKADEIEVEMRWEAGGCGIHAAG